MVQWTALSARTLFHQFGEKLLEFLNSPKQMKLQKLQKTEKYLWSTGMIEYEIIFAFCKIFISAKSYDERWDHWIEMGHDQKKKCSSQLLMEKQVRMTLRVLINEFWEGNEGTSKWKSSGCSVFSAILYYCFLISFVYIIQKH